MRRNKISPLFFAGTVLGIVIGCQANESNLRIHKKLTLTPKELQVAETFIKAQQQPKFDQPKLLPSNSFTIKYGSHITTLIPVISSQTTGSHDFISQCQLLELRNSNGTPIAKIIERQNSGLSDDYEPCIAMSPPIFIDINKDGTQDIIFSVTRINGAREEYLLSDVYLVSSDAHLCHSPEASTEFMPSNQTPISKIYAERISRSKNKRLTLLSCPENPTNSP